MCLKKKDRGGNLRLAATLPPAEPGTVEQICGEGRTNGRIVGEERAGGGVGGLGRGGEERRSRTGAMAELRNWESWVGVKRREERGDVQWRCL